MNLPRLSLAILFFVLSSFSAQLLAEIQVIARTNQAAADFPSDVSYSGFFEPVIGSSGHIAFIGSTVDSRGTNTRAVWAGLPGQLKAIIKENDIPVGFPKELYLGPSFNQTQPVLTQSGAVGILALLEGGESSVKGLLAHVGGTTYGAMKTGDQAPGFPEGFTVSDILDFAFTDAGMVIVGSISELILSGRMGIWHWSEQGIKLITSPVTDCYFAYPSFVSINQTGEVAFSAKLIKEDNKPCTPSAGVFKWSNGSSQLLISEDDPVPDMPGTRFVRTSINNRSVSPMINDQGSVIFYAELTTDPSYDIKRASPSAWVADGASEPRLLLLNGESLVTIVNSSDAEAIIFPGNLSFSGNIRSVLRNFTDDDFAVIHAYPGRSDRMLLAGKPRELQPYTNFEALGETQLGVIATTLDIASGFGIDWQFLSFQEQAINRIKQYVFVGSAQHSTNISNRVNGIWRGDGANRPRLIAKEGMKIFQNGTENTLDTIRWLDLPSSLDSNLPRNRYTRISDNGQIVFRGLLDDKSTGIFLITDDSKEQKIFNLAEQLFPEYFSPANVEDQLLEGFVYRYYPATKAYIGIKNGEVFVLGDVFGSGPQRIDTIENTLRLLEGLATGS